MRVVVITGSREWTDQKAIEQALAGADNEHTIAGSQHSEP